MHDLIKHQNEAEYALGFVKHRSKIQCAILQHFKGYKLLNQNTFVLKAYLIFEICLQVCNNGIGSGFDSGRTPLKA